MVLTTNLLARGIDVPEIELVINFDIPKVNVNGVFEADPESYLHRIGRAGRFGVNGLAVSIYDNDEDERLLWEIADYYKIKDKIRHLDAPAQIKDLLKGLGNTGGI